MHGDIVLDSPTFAASAERMRYAVYPHARQTREETVSQPKNPGTSSPLTQ